MRTNEYLFILQTKFGKDLRIESVATETEWGSTYYTVVAWLETELLKELQIKKEVSYLFEYQQGGIAACLSLGCVFEDESLDEAIAGLFYWCHDNGLLLDI